MKPRHIVFFVFATILIAITVFFTLNPPVEESWQTRRNLFRKDLDIAMASYAWWFTHNQTSAGDFVYERKVQTNTPTDDYNIVRQAGGLYGVAQLFRTTKNPRLERTLEKGFTFFHALAVPGPVPDSLAIVYKGEQQSNTSALLTLALVEYLETKPENAQKYRTFANELGQFLLSTQLPSGGFNNGTDESPEESDYNNGETFYALIRMYRLTGDRQYLIASQKAAGYFLPYYGKRAFNASFYSWGMAGFYHLYMVNPDTGYWDFMRDMTDLYFESEGNDAVDYFAKTYKVPPRSSLAVFMEGIIHATAIARVQDPGRYTEWKKFLVNGVSFLMEEQVNGPRGKYTSTFDEVKGGICFTDACDTQRVDSVQHAASATYLYTTLVH